MRRGEIYRVHHPSDDPKLYRCSEVVSRQTLIDSKFPIRHLRTHPDSGPRILYSGLGRHRRRPEARKMGPLRSPGSLRKVQLTRFVGSLTRSKRAELDRALKMALALE
jgi:hypothetical protein